MRVGALVQRTCTCGWIWCTIPVPLYADLTLKRALPSSTLADSHAPTWAGNLDGHINLRDALRRTITFTAPNGAPAFVLR